MSLPLFYSSELNKSIEDSYRYDPVYASRKCVKKTVRDQLKNNLHNRHLRFKTREFDRSLRSNTSLKEKSYFGPKHQYAYDGTFRLILVKHKLRMMTKIRNGLYVFSAALPEEKAREHGQWGHGALALSLIEGLSGRRLYTARSDTPLPADANANGLVELNELRTYVVRRVKELTEGKQHAVALPRELPALPLAAGGQDDG